MLAHPRVLAPRPVLRVLAAVLLVAASACGSDGTLSTPREPRVDRPAFDGRTAFALLEQQLAFGPRVPGSEGHRAQLEWMDAYLRERADSVSREPFEFTTSKGETLALTNLTAHFRPEAERRILLLTHWDTRPQASQAFNLADRDKPIPGANDGASGVAILLQLADMLAQQSPATETGIDLLFVDGEDYGPETVDMFLGSRHYAAHLPTPAPALAVLLDMVGDADPLFPMEGNSVRLAPQLVQRLWGIARDLGYGATFPTRVGPTVTDDHLELNRVGIPTIDIIDFSYGPEHRFWHTLEDDARNVSPTALGIVGDVVAEWVYRGG